jgi:DNA invertase Pin-like site-specific DNA recombinase
LQLKIYSKYIRKSVKINYEYVRKHIDIYEHICYNNTIIKKEAAIMEKTYGYARVSTREQNLDRQIEALKQCGIDDRDIITDKASGKDLNRQGYQSLRNTMLRDGDTLIVKSLDRLSRNKEHIKQELEYYKAHNIRVKVIDLPTTMTKFPQGQEWISDMINNILIEVLSSMAEQERITIKQRQTEGIAAAHAKGKHLGRPTAVYPDNWNNVYSQWKADQITAKAAMELLRMKRTTFYKLSG